MSFSANQSRNATPVALSACVDCATLWTRENAVKQLCLPSARSNHEGERMTIVEHEMRVDPRVRRTRWMLEEAFLALAAIHDFATITVRDITTRADLNRATFYLHYRDKDDLCTQALDGLFNELIAEDRAFVSARRRVTIDSIPVGITSVLRHCAERPDLFRRLLADSGSMGFAARFRRYIISGFLQVWTDMAVETEPGSPPVQMRARSAAASLQGVIQWWLEGDVLVPVEVAAGWAWTLLQPLWFEGSSLAPKSEGPDEEISACGFAANIIR